MNRTEEGNDDLSLTAFLGEVSLATDQDIDEGEDAQERVTLMTAHAAKGLEFNNVFIVGVEEDLFPSAMSNGTLSEIEEERRLLYVAITRARKFCMLSYASSRYRNGMTTMCSPSRFIRDINPQYLMLSSGTVLSAPKPSFASYKSSYHTPAASPRTSTAPSTVAAPKPMAFKPVSKASAPAASGTGIHTAGELNEGTVIEHTRFGRGTVTNVDTSQPDTRITVDFDNTGERVLLLKFARFSIIE